MALEKCKGCGAEVSSKATACPKCGAVIKRTSGVAKGVAIFFGLVVVVAIFRGIFGGAEPVAAPNQDPAEVKRAAFALAISKTLGKAMRSPESLKYDSFRVDDKATVACVEYRAQNGFGGMNRDALIMVDGTEVPKDQWKKRCSGNLFNMKELVEAYAPNS